MSDKRKTISISLEGDSTDRAALAVIAHHHGVTMGRLVRDALHQYLDDELAQTRLFFQTLGSSNHQMPISATTEREENHDEQGAALPTG